MYGVRLSQTQKKRVINALKNKRGVELTLSAGQFVRSGRSDFSNFTKSQITKIRKTIKTPTSKVKLSISYRALQQDGSGFITALLPMLAKAAKFLVPSLAAGVLGGAASGLTERLVGPKK